MSKINKAKKDKDFVVKQFIVSTVQEYVKKHKKSDFIKIELDFSDDQNKKLKRFMKDTGLCCSCVTILACNEAIYSKK